MSNPHVLTVIDETVSGDVINELSLSFLMGKISAKEIIAERVRVEVDLYKQKVHDLHYSLVQPGDAEVKLNQYRRKSQARIDADKQIEIALKAFESNGFFILAGDKQIENLDDLIDLEINPNISFVKLTPLVGG